MEKIFRVWFGKPLREVYAHATRFQVFKYRFTNFMRKGFITTCVFSLFLSALYGAFVAGSKLSPVTVWAEKKVEVPVEPAIPILERIAKCESGGSQLDKNGQVLLKANENGSVDSGVMQINLQIWGKKAHDMGYDLMKETDNRAFGKWLFLNYGSVPWGASSGCWNR